LNKVFLVCTGLGKVHRGFESYIDILSKQLYKEADFLNLIVFAGANLYNKDYKWIKIFNISRKNFYLKCFIKQEDFRFQIEQFTFFINLLPYLFIQKPKSIYLGEYYLYCYLFKLRKLFGLSYSLVLYTGGQVTPGLFDENRDFVHHVTDIYYNKLKSKNIALDRHFVVPHFITDDFVYDHILANSIINKALGKKIVLSVGYIDIKIKRMDLFVKLLSEMSDNIFPIILGEYSNETLIIEKMLQEYFGINGFLLNKVPHCELGTYYSVSDLFILCSPRESFGLANLEALYFGKPVLVDDYYESRYVLKSAVNFINMNDEYETKKVINKLLLNANKDTFHRGYKFVCTNYTWNSLSKDYLHMFKKFIST
jgi:glycosyltransferase involved in cell wall biosynthesis